MKYIVITSKHHDGFAMFDSQGQSLQHRRRHAFQARSAQGTGRGVPAEAGHQARLLLLAGPGLEPSRRRRLQDGHWDKAQDGNMDEYIRKIAVPQVREILTNYGADRRALVGHAGRHEREDGPRSCAALRKLQPGIITNNRLGGGFSGDTENARAVHPRHRLSRPRLGNLHDDERHLGLQERTTTTGKAPRCSSAT